MNDKLNNPKYFDTYCTGCGLCHELYKYQLHTDKRGFPTVCVDSNTNIEELKAICPSFYYSENLEQGLWGNVKQALVGFSSNEQLRYRASSGGAVTAICIYLIESGLVDGVFHTKVDPNDQTKTITCISYTRDEIISRCGSRYSISVPLYKITDYIDKQKKYAFVGKPCDVMALRRAMKVEEDLKLIFPYLISFFCAGEPSVNAQNELIKAIGSNNEDVKSLRYRGYGWPGHTTVIEKDGKALTMEYKMAWGKYLGRDIRNACRFCLDGTGDAADIVCADFWYLINGEPDFSEHDGRNLIIARNNVGYDILQQVIKSGHLTVENDFTSKIDTELHLYQPGQYIRKCTMSSTTKALSFCGRIAPQYNRRYTHKCAKRISYKIKIQYFLGTVRRILNKSITI